MLLDGGEQLLEGRAVLAAVEGRAVAARRLAPALTSRLTSPAISGLRRPLTSALTSALTSHRTSARLRTMGRYRHGGYLHGGPQRRVRGVRSRGGAATSTTIGTSCAGGISRGAAGRGR